MRIGVTVHFQFSIFSGGGASASLAVAETLKVMGHDVTLLNTNGSVEWWDDLASLKTAFGRANVSDVKEPFDLVLEVATNLPDAATRQRCGKQCVWVIRKPILLNDIENTIFPVNMGRRSVEGLTAVWCLDNQTTDDEIQYLETLTRVPVLKVPFVWTPSIVEVHRRDAGHPSWIQVAMAATQNAKRVLPWSVHVCETNTSASSSCTIPLVILRESKRQGNFMIEKYNLHNAHHIESSAFFKQNVWAHCQIQDLSGHFQGRQRVCDWALDPMSCILAHSRFRAVRPYLLDALWCRIPLVHNSILLRDLAQGYERYYYDDNSIMGGAAALGRLQEDLAMGKGMFDGPNQQAAIQKMLGLWSPVSTVVQEGWRKAIQSLPAGSAVTPVPVAAPVALAAPPAATPAVPAPKPNENVLRILFTDMWDGFNAEYNFFTLLLQEASKNLPHSIRIEGHTVQSLPADQTPNLLLFGPFGSAWKDARWAEIPKAHFTGENTAPVNDPKVFLNMCYPHADFVDERYVRLPLWMLEIDWFGANHERIQNPKPLPIDRCTRVFPEEKDQHTKFCAFVVTNPCNPVRNNAFAWLSQYKRVDSAGRLFNNVGDVIFAGLGGGGGELKKHTFLKQYKFCLAYENASAQGYTTEKLLHAKAAGCIPIYWGDPKVERDFDPRGFIDARKISTPEALVEAVRKVDEDPELYKRMYETPAIDEYKRDLVRRSLSQIGYSLLKTGLPSLGITSQQIPRFLGATSTAEAEALRQQREGVPAVAPAVAPVAAPAPVAPHDKPFTMEPLVITAATQRFLPSLVPFLSALAAQKQVVQYLAALVYLGSDVPDQVQTDLQQGFPFATFFRFPENECPSGFADYWHPQHFAWKLWILQQVSQNTAYNGRMILYMDAGVFMCRWPIPWLRVADREGICLLEDPRQINEQWCHERFCEKLVISAAEKKGQQLWAGAIAWKGGCAKANALFADAYRWSQDREVIVGPKWSGVRDGQPYGHRHDQSILSILSMRQGVARFPMDELYCDLSLRKAFRSGKSLYVHRGAFQMHKPFASGIDEAYVINLDRRADRLEKLYNNHPELQGRLERLSAVEGKNLKLTPALARLFRPHDFFWKKAIMGCALSHLTLWWQLVHDNQDIDNYLILEDDVKLQPGWEKRWEVAVAHVPEDYDVIYLGGILPPNRLGFERVKDRVNDHFSRVAPNQFFGQKSPNRYFHWCAYAYVLSRKGAEKILNILMARDGYWTSADHMICNPVDIMNLYFLDPLVAGCYQDEDPKYQTSAFNDFNRIDGFDSDLWNNDERFASAEVDALLRDTAGAKLDIDQALKDARAEPAAAAAAGPAQEVIIGKEDQAQARDECKTCLQSAGVVAPFLAQPPAAVPYRFYALKEHNFDDAGAYEREWLETLLGPGRPFWVETIESTDVPSVSTPIVIVQRPHLAAYERLLRSWNGRGIRFFVLHLSDEALTDSLEIYGLPMCQGVVRMYIRSDIPSAVQTKVLTVPLGFHWTMAQRSEDPLNKTPRLPFRNQVWSFFGTNWRNRSALLEPLKTLQPNQLLLVDSWDSPNKLNRNQYIALLLDTVFVPCPGGNHYETYRLYEALECGCVPIYVRCGNDDAYISMLQNEIGLLAVKDWTEAKILMEHFMNQKQLLENYRNTLLTGWKAWRERLGSAIRTQWGL